MDRFQFEIFSAYTYLVIKMIRMVTDEFLWKIHRKLGWWHHNNENNSKNKNWKNLIFLLIFFYMHQWKYTHILSIIAGFWFYRYIFYLIERIIFILKVKVFLNQRFLFLSRRIFIDMGFSLWKNSFQNRNDE